ncbi:4Fe-4S binding protein [uncultured Methanobrevibacter sp.]|uniref:4Fe-4S binding protein n=1 Tax=uncultured Methanobrevibacter sp. TaxID=253161 RepID=UPI002623BF2B
MEIELKKQIDVLEREITLKSVDLDEDIDDFSIDIHNYKDNEKLITISSRCVRCNLCVEECPINVISSATWLKRAKIGEDCVQCEICAQTCPVSCIYVWDAEAEIDKDDSVKYNLKEVKVPHRTLKMEDISIDREICIGCGSCLKYCPTNAISLRDKAYIEAHGELCPETGAIDSEDGHMFSYIDKNRCCACGSCANLCIQGAISLKRNLGPVVIYSHINVDQDTCVGCGLCEDNCPVEAIKVEDGMVNLSHDKCIRCNECSSRCPVGALSLEMDK